MTTRPERPIFRSVLPRSRFSWRRLGPSLVAHVFLVAFALIAPIFLSNWPLPEPEVLVSFFELEPEDLDSLLVAPRPIPALVKPELRIPRPDEPKLVVHEPPEAVPESPTPKFEEPKVVKRVEPPRPEPSRVVTAGFDRPQAMKERSEPREVKADRFSEGSSTKPTVRLAPAQVQTGGFGDPEGKATAEATRKHMALAGVGSFDLPAGPGEGNGTGGDRGARGAVASAGFGNGVAAERPGGGGSASGTIRSAGFSDTTPAAPTPRPKPAVVAAAFVPAQIVSKPKPSYTDEARSRRIEGEVVLEVLFSAAGESRVLRVVKGLGSGLDEEAVHAAEKIVFTPAKRDGQPIDFTATVRITFNLA